jgi:predicted DCC family thiol-disulfide oxidoreductase YuxK
MQMAEAVVTGGARATLDVTVLYDERCPLCRRLKVWLAGQRTLRPITFVAADSPEAHTRFPELDHVRSTTVLTVVTSDGAVYEGERAWLVCGWTLPSWQPFAENVGTGVRLRLVRLATRAVDGYRHRLIRNAPPCEACNLAAPKPTTRR